MCIEGTVWGYIVVGREDQVRCNIQF
jgi:hypothetical protein